MEDIKVGEYVRTKKGYIAQITEIDKYIWFNNKINKESGILVYGLSKVEFENLVTKHSKNIIDLIEVEDYVNGLPVRFVEENRIDIGQAEDYLWLKNEHIKSIVTKEMFSSVEYRVKNN